jgi:peroxiredoxin
MSGSNSLDTGSEAPEFTAPLVRPDGETETVALSALLADRPVLLAFYTNDFSPDCISEWCSFRDDAWFEPGADVQVVGVSKSRPSTHRRFIDHLDLPFALFSDTDLAIAEAYGVRYRLFKLLPRAQRSCFLIDRDGVVRYGWVGDHRLDATRTDPPMDEIHAAIEETIERIGTLDSG